MNYDYFCHMTHNTDNVAAEGHKHVCLNCGTEYEGRFCPECGQRASVGRLTMLSVLRSFLAVAGFSNGKLWKTLLHSVTRPGHMIREYLQGKRTYYIKPLNLLVVLSLLFVILQNVLHPAKNENRLCKRNYTAGCKNPCASGDSNPRQDSTNPGKERFFGGHFHSVPKAVPRYTGNT